MNFKKSITMALAIKEMKQAQLAIKLGVKSQQVSNWKCSGSISKKNLKRVCEAFDMPVSEFIKLGEGE